MSKKINKKIIAMILRFIARLLVGKKSTAEPLKPLDSDK